MGFQSETFSKLINYIMSAKSITEENHCHLCIIYRSFTHAVKVIIRWLTVHSLGIPHVASPILQIQVSDGFE